MTAAINLLLVEDNPGDVRLVQEELAEAGAGGLWLEAVNTLKAAMERLARPEHPIDLVLLDLSLPDSQGLETFRSLQEKNPGLAILILSGLNDETVAETAVNEGAQDFLVKGRFDGRLLARSIRYALERHRLLEEVRRLAIIDQLTGVANRRGFLLVAEHEREIAGRKRLPLTLLYADLDSFKAINDRFGHSQGDAALIQAAALLRQTVRRSDVVGRVGGDEFCVLLLEGSQEAVRAVVARFEAGLDALNREGHLPFRLSISLGLATYDPDQPCTIESLIAEADRAMYQEKLRKRAAA